MMILIADAGSTKTTWSLVDPADGSARTLRTTGLNPAVMAAEDIRATVDAELRPLIDGTDVTALYYYGAGIVTDSHRATIAGARTFAGIRHIKIESDMLGAARSLLGHEGGIAGILGTGSNSCLYDGARITANIPPLGYILGDEGSGASIGKRFAADLFKGLLPDEVKQLWDRRVGLTMADVIERVYRRPGANAFLASLMPTIREACAHEAVDRLVTEEFDRYFSRNIDRYGRPGAPLGFTGSVALHFSPQLRSVAAAHGYPEPAICADPMPGLIAFHTAAKKIH